MKILILSAFKKELIYFINSLSEPTREMEISKRRCIQTKVNHHDLLISFTGIGTALAACTTAVLCEAFKPDCILVCGTAGGLIAEQKPGDLILATQLVNVDFYELDKLLTGTPFESCLKDPHTNEALQKKFFPNQNLLNQLSKLSLPDIQQGSIAVSNIFPAPKEIFSLIKKLKCIAIEMESTGIFQAANYPQTPIAVIRAISNCLDAQGNDLGTSNEALDRCSKRISLFLTQALQVIH